MIKGSFLVFILASPRQAHKLPMSPSPALHPCGPAPSVAPKCTESTPTGNCRFSDLASHLCFLMMFTITAAFGFDSIVVQDGPGHSRPPLGINTFISSVITPSIPPFQPSHSSLRLEPPNASPNPATDASHRGDHLYSNKFNYSNLPSQSIPTFAFFVFSPLSSHAITSRHSPPSLHQAIRPSPYFRSPTSDSGVLYRHAAKFYHNHPLSPDFRSRLCSRVMRRRHKRPFDLTNRL